MVMKEGVMRGRGDRKGKRGREKWREREALPKLKITWKVYFH